MKDIFIDTNFYVALALGKSEAKEIIHRTERVLICPVVTGELLFGFKNGSKESENLRLLDEFLQSPSVEFVPLTYKTSEFFALITHQLKKAGTPLPTNDIWIAASAMEHATALATYDCHFQSIPNLLLAI